MHGVLDEKLMFFNHSWNVYSDNTGNTKYYFENGDIIEIIQKNPRIFRAVLNNGIVCYLDDNDFTREDGPALLTINNDYEYYLKGKRHNNLGPDYISIDGEITYYINDQLNNFYGPAVYKENGDMYFYLNNQIHNYNGPAVIKNTGEIVYFILGRKHNEDAGAIQNINDEERFFIDGLEMSKEKFEENINKLIKDKIV